MVSQHECRSWLIRKSNLKGCCAASYRNFQDNGFADRSLPASDLVPKFVSAARGALDSQPTKFWFCQSIINHRLHHSDSFEATDPRQVPPSFDEIGMWGVWFWITLSRELGGKTASKNPNSLLLIVWNPSYSVSSVGIRLIRRIDSPNYHCTRKQKSTAKPQSRYLAVSSFLI